MSELVEAQWAVVSERGCEASDLKHDEALALMRRLTRERVHGLCIVTATAASRFTPTTPADSQSNSSVTMNRKS